MLIPQDATHTHTVTHTTHTDWHNGGTDRRQPEERPAEYLIKRDEVERAEDIILPRAHSHIDTNDIDATKQIRDL